MKASEIIEHLLKVFYKRHSGDAVVREYGLYPWELTDGSGIRFGDDDGDALAAVERMRVRGWIKILSTHRTERVKPFYKIQLTEEGINRAEELLKPTYHKHLRDAYVATIEGIARGLKK